MIPVLIILGGIAYSSFRAIKENKPKPDADTALLPPPSGEGVKNSPATGNETSQDIDNPDYDLDEKEVNHYLKMTGVALTLSILAATVYPPLTLAAVASLTYLGIPLFKQAARNTFIEHRARSSIVETISYAGAMVAGFYVLTSFACAVFFYGHKARIKTEQRSKKRLENIFLKNPSHVWLYRDNVEIEIPFDSLQTNDVIVLQAGEFIPIDGIVVQGMASVDQHMLTGEAHPIEKFPGEPVLAATTVVAGKIFVKVEKTGAETTAANIQTIINNTEDFKASIETKAVQFSNSMAAPTLIVGGATWLFIGPVSAVAAVSCNLTEINRLSGPMGILNYLQLTAENGILVKDGRCLELLNEVDMIVFDKTGTLTLDEPHIGQIHTFSNVSESELLRLAAAAEHKLSHPIARAIIAAAKERNIDIPVLEDSKYEIGYGIKVRVDHHEVHVGSARFIRNEGILITDTDAVDALQQESDTNGCSLVYIAIDHALAGIIELCTILRPEVHSVIEQMKSLKLDICIISGDNEGPTRNLAQQIGIEHYYANVLPNDKASLIQQFRENGKSVCFVGDGINDSVALKTANVSISIHGASDAAIDSAGVILMDKTLNQLYPLFMYAKEIEANKKRSFYATSIPGIAGLGGVLLLGFGIKATLILYILALGGALTNAMWPIITHRDKKIEDE
ncbi:MAG: heavy metal translocating P-type ATPase [Sulfuricellaceae bacterium]